MDLRVPSIEKISMIKIANRRLEAMLMDLFRQSCFSSVEEYLEASIKEDLSALKRKKTLQKCNH